MKWEYKQLSCPFILPISDLNELGKEGWELVSSFAGFNEYFYYFKRELIESEHYKQKYEPNNSTTT